MKNSISFFTWENLKWALGIIALTFFTWFLEKIFDKLFPKIENMANNILTFIGSMKLTAFEKVTGILCLLILFIMWLVWYFKEYRISKKEYFDTIESMTIENQVKIKYLLIVMEQAGMSLDLLTVAENFSDEGMKAIGLTPDQIEKAKQYFKQKYGHEPN